MALYSNEFGNLSVIYRVTSSVNDDWLRNRNVRTIFVLYINLNLVFRIYRVSVNFTDINFAIGYGFKRTRHSEELRRHTHYNIGIYRICHLICSRYKESPQHGYGEFFVIKQLFRKLFCSLFDLHFLCRSLLQAHCLSVATVNFGHKKPSRSWVVALVICQ